MAIPDSLEIPPDEELNVQEINVSSPVLRAVGPQMGKACDKECKEYMLCREEERDPRKCLKEGREVTSCGLEFLYKVKEHCKNEAESFARCLEWNSGDMKAYYCRKEQALNDQCLASKLGIERPPLGYFTSIRIHNSTRPRPTPWIPKFPATPSFPEDRPIEPAKHGSRYFGWW
ncbi:NADH dehydrogenase-like protein [Dinothrombium tinctorium]|uniref:NADH dehydrogenase-like protein n=1 Tax=Dinothrombium tinctorium TaxID=1965070 RepID=A0A443R3I8_9ACAR|nr:NADH dehydrogenase-like protein [Dinothrombium tinctorium]